MDENWKPIPGFDNYEVSDRGNVRSWRVIGSNIGRLRQEPRLLRLSDNGNGYKVVKLRLAGKIKTLYVHRLVAEQFIDNPMNLPEVNHRDEDKSNNKADNLEWCEHAYNLNYGTVKTRIAEKLRGRHLSDAARQKLRETALRGERHPNFGKHLSEATRRKISEAHKRRVATAMGQC